MSQRKFAAAFDLHWGYERRSGHLVPLHDKRAASIFIQFVKDYQPDVVLLCGDILDCGPISHHNRNSPGKTEGLRIVRDAVELREQFIEPLQKAAPKAKFVWLIGNHEDWLDQLQDILPQIEGTIDLRTLMKLGPEWEIIPQGGYFNLGKLTFVHGDTVTGGEHVAKAAVIAYERSVRFGHHHTHQVYTKVSALDYKFAKNGVAVPCLCGRTPHYGKGKPNRWMQGFNWGVINHDGSFSDYVTLIVDGKAHANGKNYKG